MVNGSSATKERSTNSIEGYNVSSPFADFEACGVPDFLGGAEDGHFYLMKNSVAR